MGQFGQVGTAVPHDWLLAFPFGGGPAIEHQLAVLPTESVPVTRRSLARGGRAVRHDHTRPERFLLWIQQAQLTCQTFVLSSTVYILPPMDEVAPEGLPALGCIQILPAHLCDVVGDGPWIREVEPTAAQGHEKHQRAAQPLRDHIKENTLTGTTLQCVLEAGSRLPSADRDIAWNQDVVCRFNQIVSVQTPRPTDAVQQYNFTFVGVKGAVCF